MNKWKTVSERVLVSDRWLTLKAKSFQLPNGIRIEPYYVLEEKEWVHIVAIDSDRRVVTVRQYRPAADILCTELPAGIVEADEDIEQAARRELREETGFSARTMTHISSLWANPARQTNRVHIFLAEGLLMDAAQQLDASEDIQCGWASFESLFQMAAAGTFSQSMHVASLAMTKAYLSARSQTQE